MEKISPAVLNLLLNASWQVAVIAAAAELSTRFLRAWSAREQHRVWVAALLLSIALPLFQAARPLGLRINDDSAAAKRAPATEKTAASATIPSDSLELPATPAIPVQRDYSVPRRWAVLLAGAYFAWIVVRCAALLKAWWTAWRLMKSAREVEIRGTVELVMARCLEQTTIGRVRVVASEAIASPMTMGMAPAVVILPERLVRETDETLLASAIGHELVHIERNDYVLNFLYRMLAVPLSFHPAAWLIQRRIAQTRELRCDEVVTERLVTPTAYARSLVELAGQAIRPATTMAVGIGDADILEERIMFMLKKTKLSGAKRTLLLTSAALVFALPCIAAAPYAVHVNVQQADTAAPVPVTVGHVEYAPTTPQTAEPAQAEQKTEQRRSADFENGRHAGMLYATRGFAFAPDGQDGNQQEREAKAKREREEQQLSPEERDARMVRLKQELAGRAKYFSELSKSAKITMQQAIDVATREVPGTVLESGLVGERVFITKSPDGTVSKTAMNSGNPQFRVVILAGDENNPERHIVFVDAVTGQVVRSVVE